MVNQHLNIFQIIYYIYEQAKRRINDMTMYHVSKTEFKEGNILKTHVPRHLIKYEGDIPRICVSNSPIKCIVSIHAINNSKIYSKFFTTLFEWTNDQKCYEYITIDKMKDLFKEYERKFPHGNVTFSSFISGWGFAVFRYKSISISEIKIFPGKRRRPPSKILEPYFAAERFIKIPEKLAIPCRKRLGSPVVIMLA